MKNFTIIALLAFLICCFSIREYFSYKKIKQQGEQIKDLEDQVWSLKLDRRLDSISDHHITEFRKKLGLP